VPEERKKLTVPDLAQRKKAGEKVVMASIPDYPSAVWAERAGIDIAAVGDSLGMVSYGFPNTLPVTIDMMIAHAQAVRRGAPSCLIMVSMTYGSYATPEIGVVNALRLMTIDRRINDLSAELAEAERAGDGERRDSLAVEHLAWTRRRAALLPMADAAGNNL